MKRTPDSHFTWVDPRITVSDVRRQTQEMFAPLRDDQLKALMIQVAKISKAAGVDQDPAFAAALDERAKIMADHAARKAKAEPDDTVTDTPSAHAG